MRTCDKYTEEDRQELLLQEQQRLRRGEGFWPDRGLSDGGEYTREEVEWLEAIRLAQSRWGKFLTFTQILGVARALGYRRVGDGGGAEVPVL